MINNNKNDLSKLFIIIMIPIGLTFLMCMLPDYVPDEQAHFQRAYQVSWFHLSTGIHGMIDSDYAIMKFSDYKNIFSYININPNPTYKMYHEACTYNFICYILPAIVLAISRVLHFSLYLSYYLGRMANLILYIVLISYAIKITPKCKKIFFVLGFNPMFIHLAASYSADVLVTCISVLSIAYFLYLFEKAEISKKDIVIVMTMIFIIAMTKYVYLPVFGIYFAIIPKLLKMPKINWIVLVICAIVGCAYIYVSLKLNTNTEVIASQKEYYEAANVDGTRQLEFLLSDKLNILRVLKVTFVTKIFYYFDNFINRLGWLTIFINKFSFVFYYVILVLALFVEDAKLNIKAQGNYNEGFLTSVITLNGNSVANLDMRGATGQGQGISGDSTLKMNDSSRINIISDSYNVEATTSAKMYFNSPNVLFAADIKSAATFYWEPYFNYTKGAKVMTKNG